MFGSATLFDKASVGRGDMNKVCKPMYQRSVVPDVYIP